MGIYLRLTPATKAVIYQRYVASEDLWGLRLSQLAGRPTGIVYPLLDRLEREGFVVSWWDDDDARPGPRRRLYKLTDRGREWISRKLHLDMK